MVFNRSVKASIKKKLTRALSIAVLVVMATAFVFNAVFSQTGMNIPVQVTWNDQDASSRPSSVTLELLDGNNVVKTITLTSANQDQTDSNKWVGVFDSVPYSANYTIREADVENYEITANNLSPNTTDTVAVLNSQSSTTTTSRTLGDVNFVLIRADSGTYYLWTLENYDGIKYTQLINALKGVTGNNNLNVNTSNYKTTLPSTFSLLNFIVNQTAEVSGSEGNISFKHSYLLLDLVDSIYYGNVVTGTSDAVTFENVYNTTHYSLTVHHINEDGTEFAPDVVTQYEDGETYTAAPIDNDHYDAELQGGEATGIITEDMELTYVYHPKYHNVIYQFAGDVIPPNAETLLPATTEQLHGSTVAVAQDPAATGYRFLGWKINGSDAGASFTMPTEDVIITGTWEHFNGYFTPEISKQIINAPEYYRALDTVPFEITVTNTADFDISNVVVNELLDGTVFSNGEGYQVDSDDQATISTLAAGESITLYASYVIPKDLTQTITNTAKITSATADNYYYLDNSQEITATASFDVRSTQDDPVLTGVHSTSTILYSILMIVGAIGIGIGIVNKKRKQKI